MKVLNILLARLLEKNSFFSKRKLLVTLIMGVLVILLALFYLRPDYFQNLKPDAFTWGNLKEAFSSGPSMLSMITDNFEEFVEFIKEHLPIRWMIFYALAVFILLQVLKGPVKRAMTNRPYFWSAKVPGFSDQSYYNKLIPWIGKLKKALPTFNMIRKKDVNGLLDEALQVAENGQKSSYLFLIDEHSPNDHFARFWESSIKQFEQEALRADRFFYNGDARLCYNDTHTEGLGLDQLKEMHGESILVLIGDGYSMLNVDGAKIGSWTESFESWSVRYLLTPRNPHGWDRRESELGRRFHILTAAPEKLQVLGYSPNAEGEIKDETGEDDALVDYHDAKLDEKNLWKYFDKTTIQWIQACALHPYLNYELSIALGEKIFKSAGEVFNIQSIYALCQIPWFRTGIIPVSIRGALAKQFEESSGNTKDAVRNWLKTVYPLLRPPAESHAGNIFTQSETINEWFTTGTKLTRQRRTLIRKELNRIYSTGINPDYFLSLVNGPHNRISTFFPESWRPWIFNFGFSGLGVTQIVRNLMYGLMASFIMGGLFALILWSSRGSGASEPTDQVVETKVIVHVDEGDTVNVYIPGTESGKEPLRVLIPGIDRLGPVRTRVVGSGVLIVNKHKHTLDTIIQSDPGDDVNTVVEINAQDTLLLSTTDTLNVTLWETVPIYILMPVTDSVSVPLVQPTIVPDTIRSDIITYLPPRLFPPWGPGPHPPDDDSGSIKDTIWITNDGPAYWRRDTIIKDSIYVVNIVDTLEGKKDTFTIVIQDTLKKTVNILIPGPTKKVVIFEKDTIIRQVPVVISKDTVVFYDTVEIVEWRIDSIVSIDSLIVIDSIRIYDTIQVRIDTPLRRQVIISGVIHQCGTDEMVNTRFFKGLRIDGYPDPVFPDEKGNFSLTYLGYDRDRIMLSVSQPYSLTSGDPNIVILGDEDINRSYQVENTDFKNNVTIRGDVYVEGLIKKDSLLVNGDLMTVDSLSDQLIIQLINGPPPFGEIAHYEGFFLHRLHNLDFCESKIRLQFLDHRDTILNLRNYAITGDVIDLSTIRL